MTSKSKVYTRTGDKGQTSLFGGKRVPKYSQQVVAYGSVDELNSTLGVVISHLPKKIRTELAGFLILLQSDLLTIGARLAGNNQPLDKIAKRTGEMEQAIDQMDAQLPALKNFILPSGNKAASFAHLARTVCRRAEREVTKLSQESSVDPAILKYLNRLSDLLFVSARFLNWKGGVTEVRWTGT